MREKCEVPSPARLAISVTSIRVVRLASMRSRVRLVCQSGRPRKWPVLEDLGSANRGKGNVVAMVRESGLIWNNQSERTSPQGREGTYGNFLEGFVVTDSLPIPRLTGMFAARLNITSGALSVSERPFHPANPNVAGVQTVYGSPFGKKRCATLMPYPCGSSDTPLAATTPAMAFATCSP